VIASQYEGDKEHARETTGGYGGDWDFLISNVVLCESGQANS